MSRPARDDYPIQFPMGSPFNYISKAEYDSMCDEIDRLRQQLADTQPVIEAAETVYRAYATTSPDDVMPAVTKLLRAMAGRAAGRELRPGPVAGD